VLTAALKPGEATGSHHPPGLRRHQRPRARDALPAPPKSR
jgi:hypothetical protein